MSPSNGGQDGQQNGRWTGPRGQPSTNSRALAAAKKASSSHDGGLEGHIIDCGNPNHDDDTTA